MSSTLQRCDNLYCSSLRLPIREERRNNLKLFTLKEYALTTQHKSILSEAKNTLFSATSSDAKNLDSVIKGLQSVVTTLDSPSAVCMAQLMLGQARLLSNHVDSAIRYFQDVIYKLTFYDAVFSKSGFIMLLGNAAMLMKNINAAITGLEMSPLLINYQMFAKEMFSDIPVKDGELFIPDRTSVSPVKTAAVVKR
jgi:hypothetical protein